jgi:hypothetical protein
MIKLELDDQQAWFLTQLLVECFHGLYEKEIFKSQDENDKMTYDPDFKASIIEIGIALDKARGI